MVKVVFLVDSVLYSIFLLGLWMMVWLVSVLFMVILMVGVLFLISVVDSILEI